MPFHKTFGPLMIIFLLLVACQHRPVPEEETANEQLSAPTRAQEQATPNATVTQEAAAVGAPAGGGPDSDWPTFRLNKQHTAVRGRGLVLTEPKLRWRFDTGGVVESSAAIVDGVLYAGTFDQALYAIDALSGEERWRFPVGGLLRASPSVVDGVVYFGADDNRHVVSAPGIFCV
ncbi:MAG: PQQ-like beta-propeller repeat protein [Chloroflexota bacterium]|nr:MAG: PQQ-like beta-propeller repeat protein [Chloroflexota bacterium]